MAGKADGMPVILRELSGARREMVLDGPDLPEKGLEAPISLRAVHSRYPGGKVTSQILGVEEGEIVLRCRFNDVLTALDEGAIQQVETLRGILVGQAACELSWGSLLVRRGFLTKVAPKYERESVIGCEITFLPTEADEAFYTAVPMPIIEASSVLSFLDALDAALDATEEIAALTNAIQALV
jgi:hypothetical protein